jgi:hypothetical protein
MVCALTIQIKVYKLHQNQIIISSIPGPGPFSLGDIRGMKKYLAIDARRSLGFMFLLALCFWGFGPHARVHAENDPNTAAVDALDASSQNESWIATDVKGQVGYPVIIHLNLSPYPPPAGAFYTTIVDVLESPEGAEPEILPGVPEISVRCPKPGIYRLRIRANQIEKSSCALADFRILKEQEIRLTITP